MSQVSTGNRSQVACIEKILEKNNCIIMFFLLGDIPQWGGPGAGKSHLGFKTYASSEVLCLGFGEWV